ncbi:MAG: 1-acyl-sn-glycerol-3-phosphate acyltransferase [Candidatus Marinimicrobia bacterium]|nr:1-acyl-sn-glycerol-3-phosphate acyltransferase [Candidatus Neomarinimicrobiota bacterium]
MVFYVIKPFCTLLRLICGVRIHVEGRENIPSKNGYLVVGNHYSYVEVVSTMSVVSAVPVSKSEIRNWPIFGHAARLGGTVFVDREKGGLSGAYIEVLMNTLRKGINIIFFPEGTTTDGTYLKRFKSALFVPANRLKVPVLPIVSTVTAIDGKPVPSDQRDLIAWYGGAPFVPHAMRLLAFRRIDLKFKIGEPIIPDYDDSSIDERREFARLVQNRMDAALWEIAPDYQGIRDE